MVREDLRERIAELIAPVTSGTITEYEAADAVIAEVFAELITRADRMYEREGLGWTDESGDGIESVGTWLHKERLA